MVVAVVALAVAVEVLDCVMQIAYQSHLATLIQLLLALQVLQAMTLVVAVVVL
jgi:hypothetical protein